jgi:hypothetical protein
MCARPGAWVHNVRAAAGECTLSCEHVHTATVKCDERSKRAVDTSCAATGHSLSSSTIARNHTEAALLGTRVHLNLQLLQLDCNYTRLVLLNLHNQRTCACLQLQLSSSVGSRVVYFPCLYDVTAMSVTLMMEMIQRRSVLQQMSNQLWKQLADAARETTAAHAAPLLPLTAFVQHIHTHFDLQ